MNQPHPLPAIAPGDRPTRQPTDGGPGFATIGSFPILAAAPAALVTFAVRNTLRTHTAASAVVTPRNGHARGHGA